MYFQIKAIAYSICVGNALCRLMHPDLKVNKNILSYVGMDLGKLYVEL
jgi:hypothetical protein